MSSKLNILIFSTYFNRPSEVFIHRQVNFLKRFYRVIFHADTFRNFEEANFPGVDIIKVNSFERLLKKILLSFGATKDKKMFTLLNRWQVARILVKNKISVIHVHYGTNAIRILPIAKKMNVPLIVTFHGFDASKSLSNQTYRDQLPELFEYASKIIVVSKHMITSLHLEKHLNKVVYIPCNVNTDEFQPYVSSRRDKKIHLLHSGRIVGKKGVPDLIIVFSWLLKKHKNIHLTILGSGPGLANCINNVQKLNIQESVTFLGAQKNSIVKETLNTSDIFVLNSRTDDNGDMEGTPVSILEALSMGKAVVSTYHAGIPDIIENHYNGLLVPERDNKRLEAALNLLINDEALRNQLGQQGRQSIIEKFSDEKIFPMLNDAFRSVIISPK